MLDFRGQLVSTVTMTMGQITMQVNAVCSSPFASYCVVDATDDNNFGIYLESFVQISLTSTSRRAAVNYDKLAKCGVFTQTVQRPQYNALPKGVYI